MLLEAVCLLRLEGRDWSHKRSTVLARVGTLSTNAACRVSLLRDSPLFLILLINIKNRLELLLAFDLRGYELGLKPILTDHDTLFLDYVVELSVVFLENLIVIVLFVLVVLEILLVAAIYAAIVCVFLLILVV